MFNSVYPVYMTVMSETIWKYGIPTFLDVDLKSKEYEIMNRKC